MKKKTQHNTNKRQIKRIFSISNKFKHLIFQVRFQKIVNAQLWHSRNETKPTKQSTENLIYSRKSGNAIEIVLAFIDMDEAERMAHTHTHTLLVNRILNEMDPFNEHETEFKKIVFLIK